MTPDEIIDYLTEVERLGGNRDDNFPYVEHYLEYLVSMKDAPDRFFTNLALIYIDKLFVCLPPYKTQERRKHIVWLITSSFEKRYLHSVQRQTAEVSG